MAIVDGINVKHYIDNTRIASCPGLPLPYCPGLPTGALRHSGLWGFQFEELIVFPGGTGLAGRRGISDRATCTRTFAVDSNHK